MRNCAFFTLLLLTGLITSVHAQSGPVAAGGQASGTGGSMSYSVGQIDYKTASGTGGIITEGLQQPYEILVSVGIDEPGIELRLAAYPNPVRDLFTLEITRDGIEQMRYELMDSGGRIISSQQLRNPKTTIDMQGYASATYFLRVYSQNTELKTFKIIKNS